MATETTNAPETTEEEITLESQLQAFQPGELCPVDAVSDESRVEIEDDEFGTVEAKEACLKNLTSRAAQRDLVSRRLEVRDAWEQRYFDRGNQHLLEGPKGTWVTPSQVGIGNQGGGDHQRETNVYLPCRDIICAALTGGLPSVRFEAQSSSDPAQMSAAENSEKGKLLFERNVNMPVVQANIARMLFTDGRAVIYVREVLDAQRFGYSHANLTSEQDEVSYLPETGGEGPDQEAKSSPEADTGEAGEGEPAPQNSPEPAEESGEDRGEVRSSEVVEVYGVLETKLPIQAPDIACSAYLQFSKELDITMAKAKYPEKADEITPSQSPSAESDYERLARTSIMMGMRPTSMTSDSMTYSTTEQKTWFRPAFFTEETDDNLRQWLLNTFPTGALVILCGSTFCEARRETMDDHWTLIHARPGDGMHRPSLGSPVVPIQKKVNDVADLLHESTMHIIQRIWVDPEGVDVQALNDTKEKPKQYFPIKPKAGGAIQDSFFAEPAIQIGEWVMGYMEKLFGEWTQFTSGAYPTLFGGSTGSNDTAQGIATQRDAALGRIGLTWRNIKAGYASIVKQGVQCMAEYRKEKISGMVPGAGGTLMEIAIDPSDLKGNVLCFPDTDEQFPESWQARRAVWTNIITMAAKVPAFASIIGTPQNLRVAKDYVGTPELVIPGADAEEKQLGQIQMMLDSEPLPNPAILEAQQQAQAQAAQAAAQAQATGQPIDPQAAIAAMTAVQQQTAQMPPMVSSVPIDEDVDDMADMIATIKTWANSQEGIRAKERKPKGYANVMLQMKERMASIQKQQAGGAPPAGKPPSDSLAVNLKDIPTPEGQAQALAKVGIQVDPNAIRQQDQQDQADELAAKAAAKPQPAAMPAVIQ